MVLAASEHKQVWMVGVIDLLLNEVWKVRIWVRSDLLLLNGVWSVVEWILLACEEYHELWIWLTWTLHWILDSGHHDTWGLLLWKLVVAETRIWRWWTVAQRVCTRVVGGSVP